MDITFSDRGQFSQLAGKFRRACKGGAAIRKELTAAIQSELKSVVSDIQRDARGMNVRGQRTGSRTRVSRGFGSRARAQFDAAAEMRRASKAAVRGRTVRARRSSLGTGLRERVARSVKSKVQYTGFRLGAKVYVEVSNFPHSQRKLPRHLNRPGGWRHPVFGNRSVWAAEFGEPYFDRPIRRHEARVRRNVKLAVDRVIRILR